MSRAPGPLRILAWKPRPERQTIRMDRVITCEPLELEYLYTMFEADEVTLLDGMTDRRDPVRVCRKARVEVVLMTSFITNIHTVLDAARRLKQLPCPPLVFVGGPHAEVLPEHFFDAAVDGVFFANQLEGVRLAVERFRAGLPFHDVPGGAFPVDGHFVRVPGAPLVPATLPRPRRILLERAPQLYRYLYFERCASVKTAFGCHQECTFCFCTEQQGGRYGPRPLSDVIEEIADLPVENVFILDDNFLVSRHRVLEFCLLVEERGLKKRFIIYGGSDFVAQNPDVMARLRAAGVEGLICGFEFATDDALATVHKKARLQDNDRTVALCRELGIELFALFMVDPDWPVSEFRRLRDYVREHGIVFATFATYTVFPGTELARSNAAAAAAGQATTPAPGPPWWRYDLLRLHQRPRHLSPLRYYLWLFYLYLLPGLSKGTSRRLRKLYGTWGFLRLLVVSWIMGLEFLLKLLIWR